MPTALAPRFWAGHLLALVLVAVAVGLGLWQLDAWSQRRADAATDLTRLQPVALDDVIGPDDPFPGRDVGRPVTVRGVWVPAGTVLVSDREQDGADGFWVVTPVAVGAAGAPAVPVVRGWVDSETDAPAPPSGPVEVDGVLQPDEGTGAVDADPRDDVLPQLRIADLVQRVPQDLYGGYVIRTGADPAATDAGLAAADPEQLPSAGRFTALRNFLYAIEWWIFAAFAVFVWWRWVRDTNSGPSQDESGAGPSDDADTEPTASIPVA